MADQERHGDFAKGERTKPAEGEERDFAEGAEQKPPGRHGDFAEGIEHEHSEREGSFAEGERAEDEK